MNIKNVFRENSILYEHDVEDIDVRLKKYQNQIGLSLLPNNGRKKIKAYSASPWHGRSHTLLNSDNNEWIVIKGSGCPYLESPYFKTPEIKNHIWGMIDGVTAENEFIKMTKMQNINIPTSKPIALKKIKKIKIEQFSPHLIYYSVKSPFRLIDLDFMNKKQKQYIKKLISDNFPSKYKKTHLIVLDKISEIVSTLYSKKIVHNALTTHNITCALEIVDFEASFEINKSDEDFVEKLSLIPREIIQLHEIAFAVSWWFQESYKVDEIQKILDRNGLLKYLNS